MTWKKNYTAAAVLRALAWKPCRAALLAPRSPASLKPAATLRSAGGPPPPPRRPALPIAQPSRRRQVCAERCRDARGACAPRPVASAGWIAAPNHGLACRRASGRHALPVH